MRRFIAFALSALLYAAPSHALPPQRSAALGVQASHGPGARGFLPLCSGSFAISNTLLQSNTFSNASWTLQGIGVAAPAVTSTTDTAPDGTATATTITIPAVPASGNSSAISQRVNAAAANYAYTSQVWAKATGGTPYLASISNAGTNYKRVPIVADGAWHPISMMWPGGSYTTTGATAPYLEIGVDFRDTGQTASTGTITLSLWHAQVTGGRGAVPNPGYTPTWPYIATTTAASASTVVSVQCPPGLAFRDFSRIKAYNGNYTPLQTGSTYQAGGVSAPYISPQTWVGGAGGGKYYAFLNATDTNNHNHWCTFPLYAGTPYGFAEVAPGTPQIIAPGSNCPAATVGTGAIQQYLLHPWQSPYGCTVSSVYHPICWYFSAMNNPVTSTGNSGIYMAYADTLLGPYTVNTTAVLPISNAIGALAKPGIPSAIGLNGTTYLYTSSNNNNSANGTTISYSTNGTAFTLHGAAIPPPIAGVDWDQAGLNGIIDSAVSLSKCGFYEYLYTAYLSAQRVGAAGGPNQLQQVGYAVSDSPLGPWFKFNGANGGGPRAVDGTYHGDLPFPTSLWGSGPPPYYLGDPAVVTLNGMWMMVGNFDDGNGTSSGVTALMPDACAN